MSKILGISALAIRKGNWNNGFDNMARKTSDGVVFATDKSRKYSIREAFKASQVQGQKVLITTMKEGRKVLTLEKILEKHELLSSKAKGKEAKAELNTDALMRNFIDVRLFGAVLAVSSVNIGLTGPLSMNFGTNVYVEDGNITNNDVTYQISSFAASSDSKDTTTLGSQNMIEKAVLSFPFTFNPTLYKSNMKDMCNDMPDEEIEEMLQNDIVKLKESMCYDATNMRSCFKMGTNNLFNIFIETRNDDDNINFIALEKIFIEEIESLDKISYRVNMDNIIKLIDENEDKIASIEIYKTTGAEIEFLNIDRIPVTFINFN